MTASLFFGGFIEAVFQRCAKISARGFQAALYLLDLANLGCIDLIERRLNRLDLEQTVRDYFAFELTKSHTFSSSRALPRGAYRRTW